MAKQPYIPFYCGDYIKDTRVLPLNVRGGWVDLILAMWDNDPKGEITGNIEDFSRIMNCSLEEANLVIQILKQKKTFAWGDLPDGQMRIVSRKQKKMQNLSESRKKAGKMGGNPKLVNNSNKHLVNQNDNLNPEYENTLINKVSICPEMVKIFKSVYPKYPSNQDTDFPACLQIAYKIADSKEWTHDSALNGKIGEVLKIWRYMVDFSSADPWFSTRAISDFNKEYQRLVQKITNVKKDLKDPVSNFNNGAPPLKKI